MLPLLLAALFAASPAPPWVLRVVPAPVVAFREADVLGSPVVEGIAIDRLGGTLGVYVVDSRTNPPKIAAQRDLPDGKVVWLRAGRRDGFARNEIAVDVSRPRGETAYLLRLERSGLAVVKSVHGKGLTPGSLR